MGGGGINVAEARCFLEILKIFSVEIECFGTALTCKVIIFFVMCKRYTAVIFGAPLFVSNNKGK